MKHIKLLSALLAALMVINAGLNAAFASGSAFELIRTDKSDTLGGTIYYYRHKLTGAEVVYNDNNSDSLQFALGFKTPPIDSKGANHVLEHALFCGSEKYPTKNLMHYIQNGTSSLILNGITADDCTYYLIMTGNETEYFNMIDVYMNGIFHP
ncbi:MAG: insulinase family protein, partial [Oscillospiraceae bacterium]|nr:insulinase family protein [Oscillospiraceae bacterium]